MFDDSIKKAIFLKIFEMDYISRDFSRATNKNIALDLAQSYSLGSIGKYTLQKVVDVQLEEMLDAGIVYACPDDFDDIDCENYVNHIQSEWVNYAEWQYRNKVNVIKANLGPAHEMLLDEIVNAEQFCIEGSNMGNTLARISIALDLAKYDLVKYSKDDYMHLAPMATVLGGIVNNDYLIENCASSAEKC